MKNKKIAIVTLNGYVNYGNRVQNYALETILNKINQDVETILLEEKTKKLTFRQSLFRIKQKITKNKWREASEKRQTIFKQFSKEYLNETNKKYDVNKDLSHLNIEYNKFIVGSDQVWNPSMNFHSPAYFLQFADESKRISYSASFGVSTFEQEIVEKYKNWLDEIPNISVREEDGARIVKEMTNKKVPVLVDPTMLLSKDEWLELAKPGKSKPSNKYLLTYFLGATPDEYQSQVQAIAKENSLEIINIGDQEDPRYYETGPSEFIDYINDAEIFCTDSFHGVIFSILLEKPFIVYERKGSTDMYSRIRTIIDNFGLQSREYKNIQSIDNILDIDYSGSYHIIEKEKEKSLTFLKKALSQ